jgi:hypothetical protein
MKTSSVVLAIASVAVVGIGIAVALKSGEETPQTDPRVVKTYTDGQGVWWSAVYSGPSSPTVPAALLTPKPLGPFADQQAATTAGNNWISEHPLV